MLKFLLPSIFLFLNLYLTAQHQISSVVTGEEGEPLIGATAVLLNSEDSTMVEFSLTNGKGEFLLRNISNGSFILQITYVGYDNYMRDLTVSEENKNIELDPIILSVSSEVLQEITIKAEHIPLGVRGDTLSYNAAAFKTKPNASVEDLLKKLPGIQVERDGSIKAQGEDVDNVLVDGKEFFGSDHRLATQNLEAEAVDKVEVYDKKSEIAEFTGVDDGQEEKTINLKLKEDHKKGGFGNARIAGGNDMRYDSKLNYFRFSPAMQTSVILSSNNINEQTFSFNDQMAFMGGMNALFESGAAIQLSGGRSTADGVNTSLAGGLNFNYDFSPKISFNSHYLYRFNDGFLESNTNSTNFNNLTEYQSFQQLQRNIIDNDHAINTKTDFKPNPFFNVTSRNNFSWSDNLKFINSNGDFFNNNGPIGNTVSDQALQFNTYQITSNNLFKNKFKKEGRSIISRLTINHQNQVNLDSVYNYNFLGPEALTVHQEQLEKNIKSSIRASSNYSEKISKRWIATIGYAYNYSKEDPLRNFFDFVDGEKTLNTDLSNGFNNISTSHNFSGGMRRNAKKLKLNFGLGFQLYDLIGNDLDNNQSFGNEGNFWLPNADLEYNFTGTKSVRLNYSTNVNLPGIRQLSPIPDNTNPNAIYQGNPNLLPEYTQQVGLNFNYFDQFNSVSSFTNIRWDRIRNKIVNKISQDENLFSIIEPLNTDNYNRISFYGSFSSPIRKLGIDLRLSSNSSFNYYESYINNNLSNVAEQNYNLRVSFSNRKTTKVLIESGARIGYNIRNFQQFKDFNQSYSNIDYFIESAIYFPKKWTFDFVMDYSTYSNASFAGSTNFLILGCGLEKVFWNERITASLRIKDLLNNNIGYRRNTTAFSLEEERFNAVGRTFLVGLQYKLGKGKDNSGMIFIDQ